MAADAREKIKKYCAVLGVAEGAGAKELKKAYHCKAAKLHPDVCPNDPMATEAFRKVNIAYQYLKKDARGRKKKSRPKINKVTRVPASDFTASRRRAVPPALDLPPEELAFRLKYSSNTYVRIHAVRTLRKTGGKEAVWAVLPAIEDTNRQVAAEAVAALGMLGARIAVLPLIQLYNKADTILQLRIQWALKRIDSPIAARFVSRISPEKEESTTLEAPRSGEGSTA